MYMPKTLEELAEMIAQRDDISFEEAIAAVRDCMADMEHAFYTGSINEAEDILASSLSLEPDYLDLFIL